MALTDNLIAYYKMDEASGTAFNDSHSTNHGTTTDITFNVTGKLNKGLQTDAATDRIIAPIDTIGWSEFSFQAWIYCTGNSGFRAICWQGSAYIQLDNSLKVFWTEGVGGGNSDLAVPFNEWVHIVCTMKNGGNGEVYVNGAKQTAGTWACSNNMGAGNATLDFFTRSGSTALYGTIDEVAVWQRQLGDAEVTALYNSGNGFAYPFVVAPDAVTGVASAITTTTATLNGTIDPNSASTTCTFDYGETIAYGSSVTAAESPQSGADPVAVTGALTSLSPSTTYHFRAKGVNAGGTSNGADAEFTTEALAATATLGGGWSSEYNIKKPKEKKPDALSITIMPPLTKQQELDLKVIMLNPEIKWGN